MNYFNGGLEQDKVMRRLSQTAPNVLLWLNGRKTLSSPNSNFKNKTNVISIVFLNFKNYIQTKVLDKVSTINSICGKHYNIYKLIHL